MSHQPAGIAKAGPPDSRSIYRGHGLTGIGENPGSAPVHGQQFLYADDDLWDSSLPDQLRWWMTLDDRAEDRWALGERIEAWSYLSLGNLVFVVRLAAAGLYRGRSVYFSHGRAWRAEDCGASFDPGALLGWSQAFDAPWRDARPAQDGVSYPAGLAQRAETTWKSAVQNESAAAIQFLSALLEACKTGVPLVIAVPLAEFVEGSALYQLIAFAHAALPLRLKKDCRVRIFTTEPAKALSEQKCNLIVIPEDLAPDALAARGDAILLDRRGRSASSSRKIDTAYATAVVERMGVLPSALFAFSARFDRTPELASQEAVRLVYNLAAIFPPTPDQSPGLQQDRDGLLGFLNQTSANRSESLPWDRLIDPTEWQQFSTEALNGVAFSPAETPGAANFRRGGRTALASRHQIDNEKLHAWWPSVAEERRMFELQELVTTNILSTPKETAKFVEDFTVPQVEAMLGDPEVHDILAWIDGSPRWAAGVAANLRTLPALVTLASNSAFWHKLAFAALETSLATAQPLPEGGASLRHLNAAQFQSHLPIEDRIANHLLLAEALDRAGHHDASRAEIGHLRAINTAASQRRLLSEIWSDPRWRALRKYFRPSPGWYANTREFILQHHELIAGLDVPGLLRLAVEPYRFPPAIQAALDKKMQEQTAECTSQLHIERAWLGWRLGTSLKASELRTCALAWLYRSPSAPTVLEEWKQFCIDLGDLRPQDLDGMPQGREAANWPLIKMFEPEQFADMAKACPDLGVLAQIAESFNTSRPPYDSAMQSSRFRDFPPGILSLLRVTPNAPQHDVSWDDLQKLYNRAGHRQPIARQSATEKVLAGMKTDLNRARETVRECELKSDPYFQGRIATLLCRPETIAEKSILRWLESELPSIKEPLSRNHQALRQAAAIYTEEGFPRLSQFLWPGVQAASQAAPQTVDRPTDPLLSALIRGLFEGSINWSVALESANQHPSDSPNHPFRQIAQAIRDASESEQNKIDQNVWTEFQRASFLFVRSTGKAEFVDEPASLLELAGVLSTADIGEIAGQVAIFAGAVRPFSKPSHRDLNWWRRLIQASKSCPRRTGLPDPDDRFEYVTASLSRVLQMYPVYSESTLAPDLRELLYGEWESQTLVQ